MRTLLIAAVAAGLSVVPTAAAWADDDDGDLRSADVTRPVPASRQGETQWASYTITVRPNSADLSIRNRAGDEVTHSSTPLRDDGGLPVLDALSRAGGACGGGDHVVLWNGGEVVADRTACSGAVRAALAPVDAAFNIPKLFDQIADPPGWPVDPNGEPLQAGRQPYI